MNYSILLAIRGLRRNPFSSTLALLALSVGIAATVTCTTILTALSGDPIPGVTGSLYLAWTQSIPQLPEATRHHELFGQSPPSRVTPNVARDFESQFPSSSVVIGEFDADISRSDGDEIEQRQHILATNWNFARILKPSLLSGRFWSEHEENDPVAVIDSDLAAKLFPSGNAIGSVVSLNGHAFRILGVVHPFKPRPHFYGLSSWSYSATERERAFIPYEYAIDARFNVSGADGCLSDGKPEKLDGSINPTRCAWLSVWLHLSNSADVEKARNYLNEYSSQPGSDPRSWALLSTASWLTTNRVIPNTVKLNFLISLCFLVLCMIDAAALMTAKFLSRTQEISLRRALGASRPSVFSQYLLESLFLTLVAGFTSVPMILVGLFFTRAQSSAYFKLAQASPSLYLLLFSVTTLVGLLVGIIPAWRVASSEPGLEFKEN